MEDELRDLLTKLQTDITDDSVQQITARILTNGKQKDIIEVTVPLLYWIKRNLKTLSISSVEAVL